MQIMKVLSSMPQKLHVHLKKEGREEELSFNNEEEDKYEVLSVSHTPLVVEHRVGGVDLLDLPCLALGKKSNLNSNDMADLWRQGISVNDDTDPDPGNIPYEVPHMVND